MALDNTPLFAALPARYLESLAVQARRRSYKRGETIFRHGDVGNALYFLEAGRVKIVVTSEQGEDVLLAVLGPGEVFGELSVFDGLPRSATVEVIEDAVALSLDRQ